MPEGGFRTGLLVGMLVAAVVGLAVALLLTSGDEAGEPSTVTSTVNSTSTATVTTAKPGVDTGGNATPPATEAAFSTPSGNIVCLVTGESATCGVTDFTYEPPPPPADCDLPGFGHVVGVAGGAGEFVCAGNAPASPNSKVLPYGEGILVGPFACGSSEAGVRCAHRDTRTSASSPQMTS